MLMSSKEIHRIEVRLLPHLRKVKYTTCMLWTIYLMVLMKFHESISQKKTKRRSSRELSNELKLLLHNPNVPGECFDDLEIQFAEIWSLLKGAHSLADHGLALAENNTSYHKNERKYLGTLSNLPAPPKLKKLSGRVGKGNESRKYFTSINIIKNLNIAINLCKDFHNKTIAFKNEKIVDQSNDKSEPQQISYWNYT